MTRNNQQLVSVRIATAVIAITTALAAQAASRDSSTQPEAPGPARDLPDSLSELAPGARGLATNFQHEPAGVLTIDHALELTILHNPELAASSNEVLAAGGHLLQAGALPNPELELVAGEFAGSGIRKGYGAAETSVRLSQPVDLGGKRGRRQRVAASESRLARWAYEATRLNVLTQTRRAFIDVLHAQEHLALAASLMSVAEELHKAVAEKVKAGKVPFLEQTKAGVEVANARIAWNRAGQELKSARRRLAAAWGGTAPVFDKAAGELPPVSDIPPLEKLPPLLANTPDVARWNDELALAAESLALEKAARIPDIDISAGVIRFEEDGTYAGTVGLSLPLPFFDRNTGGIIAAGHLRTRAEHLQRAAGIRALTDLAEAYGRLDTAHSEALAIKMELIPGAQLAFEAAHTGYREGKFSYLEVLDAQRTLGEARARYIDILAAYHKAAADVERLTRMPLGGVR